MPEKTFEHHLKKLRSEEEGDRVLAVQELGKFGKKAGPVLTMMLDDESETVQHKAATILGDMKYEEAIPVLVRLATGSGDLMDYKIFGKALGEIGPKSVEPLVITLKNHPQALWRCGAAYVLRYFKDEQLSEPLIEALKDEDVDVRTIAIQSLGKIRSEEAIPHLMPLLDDEERDVKFSALKSLVQINPKEMTRVIKLHEEATEDWEREELEEIISECEKGGEENA